VLRLGFSELDDGSWGAAELEDVEGPATGSSRPNSGAMSSFMLVANGQLSWGAKSTGYGDSSLSKQSLVVLQMSELNEKLRVPTHCGCKPKISPKSSMRISGFASLVEAGEHEELPTPKGGICN
jgi:hypothetical protein